MPISGRPTRAISVKRLREERILDYKTYMCTICGFIYDEQEGYPEGGIPAGTKWEDIPADWTCPQCGASKDEFELTEL